MFRPTRPLFRFDPGWLFIVAGLTVCAAGILLPAQAGLHRLREQLRQLGQEEDLAYARLKGHLDFIDGFDRADARLVRRMAATHLNLIPAGDEPLLLAPAGSQTVTDWIDATVSPQPRDAESWHDSILSRWATGQERLWLFAAGALCVFVGLLLDPAVSRALPTGRGVEPEAIRRVAESAGYSGAGIVESETRWQVAAELAADRNDDDSPRWQAKGSVRRADATSHAPEIDPPQSGRGAVGDDAPEAMAAAAGGTEPNPVDGPASATGMVQDDAADLRLQSPYDGDDEEDEAWHVDPRGETAAATGADHGPTLWDLGRERAAEAQAGVQARASDGTDGTSANPADPDHSPRA